MLTRDKVFTYTIGPYRVNECHSPTGPWYHVRDGRDRLVASCPNPDDADTICHALNYAWHTLPTKDIFADVERSPRIEIQQLSKEWVNYLCQPK